MLGVTAAIYFALRLFFLKKSIREVNKDLKEINENLTLNRILRLPMPDRDLEAMMLSINDTLEGIRKEREKYKRREREFQLQIESVSHDLRTPLTVILGYLKLWQGKKMICSWTEEQREVIKTMERKARIMEKLVNQFYEYSRLYAEDYSLNIETVDVNKILREIFLDNCILFEQAKQKVILDFENHPVWTEGEKFALERIFSNLLRNAARYAESYFYISLKEDAAKINIVFENDTSELTEEDLTCIFQPFYMKEKARNQDGTGLGLAIANFLAEKIGGQLTASIITNDSERNKGDSSVKIVFLLTLMKSGKFPASYRAKE